MKNIINTMRLRKMLTVLALCTVVFGAATEAFAVNAQIFGEDNDPGTCVVNRREWSDRISGEGLTLKMAIYYANEHKACYKSIILDTDVDLRGPIELTTVGGADVNNAGNSFVIDGSGVDGTAHHVLDASLWAASPGECIIEVSKYPVVLKNMTVRNVTVSGTSQEPGEEGSSSVTSGAVCLYSSGNQILDVDLSDIDGDGFVFGSESTSNFIDEKSSAMNIQGIAVNDFSTNVAAWNTLRPTSRVIQSGGASGEFVIDANSGVAKWTTDASGNLLDYNGNIINLATENMFSVSVAGSEGELMGSARASSVQIVSINEIVLGGGQYDIRGFIMSQTPEGTLPNTPVTCTSAACDSTVNLIGLFGYVGSEIKFLGYVGKSYGYGLQSDGSFKFMFDTRKCQAGLACNSISDFSGVNKLVLVPMYAGADVVGPSGITGQVIQIRGRPLTFEVVESNKGSCEAAGQLPTCTLALGGGGGSGMTMSNNNLLQFQFNSVSQCQASYSTFLPTLHDPDRDSDRDGIADFIEMSVKSKVDTDGNVHWIFAPDEGLCSCEDDTLLSCWNEADSDGDGIMDGKEGYPSPSLLALLYNTGCQSDPADPTSCYGTTTTTTTRGNKAWDITDMEGFLDSDADDPAISKPIPDVKETDSDGDGKVDGMEDRTRLFHNECKIDPLTGQKVIDPTTGKCVKTTKEYIHERGAADNSPFHGLECNLDSIEWGGSIGGGTLDKSEIGVAYGTFVYGGTCENAITYPKRVNDFGAPDFTYCPDSQIVFLECRNANSFDDNNFNGSFQKGNSETDLKKADTDGDCVCDGEGSGCLKLDDAPYDATENPDGSKNPQAQNCMDFELGTESHNGIAINAPQTNGMWLNDKCPTDKKSFTNDCWECIEDEFLLSLARNPEAQSYVTCSEEGAIHNCQMIDAKLADGSAGNDSIPDLFEIKKTITWGSGTGAIEIEILDYEKVYSICGDYDGDGIPNCVERWDGKCSSDEISSSNFLNPYDRDTDQDGLWDGSAGCGSVAAGNKSDVCPFAPGPSTGQSDEFVEDGSYRCDPYKIYSMSGSGSAPKILAYYLDRDCDGLSDGLEDMNQDGLIARLKSSSESDLENRFKTETDPLSRDSDSDGLYDKFEHEGHPMATNPADDDTDDDGLKDIEEDVDCVGCGPEDHVYSVAVVDHTSSCELAEFHDTDPTKADTDGDGLNDGIELDGENFYGLAFTTQLIELGQLAFLSNEGFTNVISDPTAKDSDNDGIDDGAEYNGVLSYNSSHPCMDDSDADTVKDAEDACPLNPNRSCVGGTVGADTDGDSLPDEREIALGTDPNYEDTDRDGLFDGEEDNNKNGIYEPWLGESNATLADSDSDGLTDGYEKRYDSDPTISDTDGDCIPDGIEDANRDGMHEANETSALSSDSDGDGLPDGWIGGMGEDRNCNGIVDTDESGARLETDPRMPDTDLDGVMDYDEMFDGGAFSLANISQATTGQSGCTMVPNSGGSSAGMIAMLLGLAPAMIIRMRKFLRLGK